MLLCAWNEVKGSDFSQVGTAYQILDYLEVEVPEGGIVEVQTQYADSEHVFGFRAENEGSSRGLKKIFGGGGPGNISFVEGADGIAREEIDEDDNNKKGGGSS